MTSNRGLAGGYNSNIVKAHHTAETFTKEELDIYAVGAKGVGAAYVKELSYSLRVHRR